MTKLQTLKTAAVSALAVAPLLTIQAPNAVAADNPFQTMTASGSYAVVAAEGSTKCGAGMGGMGMGAGRQGCGMMRMDTNGDGKVSKEEFMKGHEAMFQQMDTNGDGMLDAAEHQAHRGMMGKCGQGKGTE